jgi:hypothetical protein
LQPADEKMTGADLSLAEEQRGVVPAAIKQIHDRVRDGRHFRLILPEPGDDGLDVRYQERVGEFGD